MARSGKMTPRDRLTVRQAAEDWLEGLTVEEIGRKYGRHKANISRWQHRPEWKEVVEGRERMKRRPRVAVSRKALLDAMQLVAYQWVLMGKPSLPVLAEKVSREESQLEEWMESPYWKTCVRHAEDERQVDINPKISDRYTEERLPIHLMEQAMIFWLAGWNDKDIGEAVGRSRWTVVQWKTTKIWKRLKEEVMLNRVYMLLIDNHLTLRQVLREVTNAPVDRGDRV